MEELLSKSQGRLSQIIAEAERAELTVDDSSLSADIRNDRLRHFVRSYISDIIDYLHELKELRGERGVIEEAGGRAYQQTHVEGYSDHSAAEALSSALEKSAKFFSESADVTLVLEQLIELPNGGHRATVEVRVIPFSFRHKPHVKGMDIQLKRIHDHEYYAHRKYEEEHIPHMIFDHFAASHSATPVSIPPYFLVNINDARLLNHMLEKQFLKAGLKVPSRSFEGPQQILVRAIDPKPKPEPH